MLSRRAIEDDPIIAEMLRRGLQRRLVQENPPEGGTKGNVLSVLRALAPVPMAPVEIKPYNTFTENNPLTGETANESVARVAPVVNDPPTTRLRRVLSQIPEQPITINEEPIPQRPLEPALFTPPATTEGLETRLRRVLPEDPLTVARENADAARRLTLTDGGYGFDKEGNPRTGPKKGFWGRLAAGGKMFGRGVAPGMAAGGPVGGLGGGLAAVLAGIIDPSLPAQARKQEAVRRNEGVYENELGRAKVESDIQSDQIRNAVGMDALRRGPIERQTKAEELERDNLRGIYTNLDDFDPVKNPEHAAIAGRAAALGLVLPKKAKGEARKPIEVLSDDGMTYVRHIWNEERGDYVPQTINGRPVVTRKVSPLDSQGISANTRYAADAQRQARGEARSERQSEREYEIEEKRRAAQETRATLERQIQELKRQQAAAQAAANDPSRPEWARLDAAKQAEKIQAEIAEKEVQFSKTSVPTLPRTTLPKLSEQQIRDAAREKNLDPDEAVRRAKARGQL